jgi:hypothetical protein
MCQWFLTGGAGEVVDVRVPDVPLHHLGAKDPLVGVRAAYTLVIDGVLHDGVPGEGDANLRK